jgi:hypothetical protein
MTAPEPERTSTADQGVASIRGARECHAPLEVRQPDALGDERCRSNQSEQRQDGY